MKTKLILFYICFNLFQVNAQVNDVQNWTRLQYQYKTERLIGTEQIESRIDLQTNKLIIQTRLQLTNNFENIQSGVGITFTGGEFRLHQVATHDIHRVIFEQRFFEKAIYYRLRYMIYPEVILNKDYSIFIGIEPMFQCSNVETIKHNQTRLMIDLARKLNNNKIRLGYMSCILQSKILHVIRLTIEFNYHE